MTGLRGRSMDGLSLAILAAYAGVGLLLATLRLISGGGALLSVAAYAAVLGVIAASRDAKRRDVATLREWLPLLALPLLYAAIPTTALRAGPFDGVIQGLDRSLFGGDVAHALAGAIPSRTLSELLHGAYLSYYLVIYVPPLLMYGRGALDQFRLTVLTFTMAMTVSFALFWVFPVEGPRYVWPPPPGIPDGFFRRVALAVLQGGSSRGTAFPSSHQAIALAMTLSSMHWSRRLGAVTLALTLTLGVGAVYGGFHYATDMVAGGLVGLFSWWAARSLAVKRQKAAPA